MATHVNLINRSQAALVLVDIQERIVRVMENRDSILKSTKKLLAGFKVLGCPIYYTEQYPKGLGPTEPEILHLLGGYDPFVKMTFSITSCGGLMHNLKHTAIKQVVLAGMETHVCIVQSALALKQLGYEVFVPADCVCSRKEIDYRIALDRMEHSGINITTMEMVLFELIGEAGTESFKKISQIVKL